MVSHTEENSKLRRRQKLKERIEEINVLLPAMLSNVEQRLSNRQDLRPGLLFLVSAPPADHEGEQETSPSVMLLRHEGNGLWICSKVSVEISYLGPFDLIVDPEEWTGGFPILLEAWNTVILHTDDMKGKVFEEVNPKWVEMARMLFHAYQRDGEVPDDLVEFTGLYLDEDDTRWAFRLKEMDTLERVRMRYHEGWKWAESAKALMVKIGELVWEIVATVPLRPAVLQAATMDLGLDLSQKWHTPLIRAEEDALFSVVISQERDMVYLRIYPKEEGLRPDAVRIQNEDVRVVEMETCSEIQLGKCELLSQHIEIEIRAERKRFLFHVSFEQDSEA